MTGVGLIGVRPRLPSLQQADEFISFDFAITKDGCQQARADSLTRVYGQNCAPAVGVTKEVVAALDSRHFEPRLPQRRQDLSSRDARKPRHATLIFWTPMKSSGSTPSP